MKLLKFIAFSVIKFINLFFRPFRVKKNRIVFSSYFAKEPEGNLKCVLHVLKKQARYEIHTIFMKYGRGLKPKLGYFLNILKEIYYYNTSKVVVLEGNSLVLAAMKKKKNVYTLQLWHAAGAFKKFGQDTDRLYQIKGLDAAVVSGKNVIDIYAQALNIPKDHVHALGIPRLDPLFSPETVEKNARSIREKYPDLIDKKILLYAPTFRGKGIDDISAKEIDFKKIADGLPDGYTLAVRWHPLMRRECPDFTDLSNEDLIEVLCAADLLVTDYSSIIFEYSALKRPMLFLAPDLSEYTKTRGFYQDYQTFVPGKICRSEEELIEAVKRKDFEIEKVKIFADNHIDFHDNHSTERVVDFINRLMQGSSC